MNAPSQPDASGPFVGPLGPRPVGRNTPDFGWCMADLALSQVEAGVEGRQGAD